MVMWFRRQYYPPTIGHMTPKKQSRLKTPSHKTVKGECVIPGAMPAEALSQFVVNEAAADQEAVKSYVELEARGEKVEHLEKVASESVFGQPMDAWDVRTNKARWWVITNPTNLYSQDLLLTAVENGGAGEVSRRSKLVAHKRASL
jgi:hypothetical protein